MFILKLYDLEMIRHTGRERQWRDEKKISGGMKLWRRLVIILK
jgi:hypothetical protein